MTVPIPSPDTIPISFAWERAREETVAHLQRLIRTDTVNPPGNEIVVARYLEEVLSREGIETVLLEPAPGRAAVVARLRGSGARGPVLLLAHMDVVGVERAFWSVDPFGGEIRGGYLYGRGAIDDKGMLAANLETMLLLQRHVVGAGVPLARDVVFVATSDEEAGGEWGIDWLAAKHPELIRAELALNEGGRTRIVGGRPLYLAVQCAEKVPHRVRLVARGPGGHASIPLPGNAVGRLGRALAIAAQHREPLRLGAVTRGFFGGLSRVWPDATEARAMRDIVSSDPRRVARGARTLSRVPALDALLRNGISPTMVQGGIRGNVIPTEAAATLDVRLLPGERIERVAARLAREIADPMVHVEPVPSGEGDVPASPVDSPMFASIAAAARTLDPALAVVPYLSTGATDSARLRARGVQAYGILPFPMTQEDEDRMHGNDERIPLAALHFGTRLIFGAIARVAR
ncbi:MAG TPA: M20/M25/M40 family metallo-hydrolase [Gemmatimonadaceae bacterium]|nr:M20/M25/M40 family metallo-hydrolase [Gemmatimonadaceae bacterium]